MQTQMSNINVTFDWNSFKSHASMLNRLDDLMQFATDEGRVDLADALHAVYLELEVHLIKANRAKLAVVK